MRKSSKIYKIKFETYFSPEENRAVYNLIKGIDKAVETKDKNKAIKEVSRILDNLERYIEEADDIVIYMKYKNILFDTNTMTEAETTDECMFTVTEEGIVADINDTICVVTHDAFKESIHKYFMSEQKPEDFQRLKEEIKKNSLVPV